MTRKSISNVFALAGTTLVVCGFVFSHNGGIVTLAIFGGWICLLGTLGFRMNKQLYLSHDDMGPEHRYDPSAPYNPFRSFD